MEPAAAPTLLNSVRHDPLLRLLSLNVLSGVAVAVIAVSGLLLLDVNGLRHLILTDQSPVLALAVLLCGFALTLGGGLIGTAMVRLDDQS
jgi:hypothetical protein